MPKWSATTLLRELTDYQTEEGWTDEDTLGSVIGDLKQKVIDDTLEKSRRRPAKDKNQGVLKVDDEGRMTGE